MTCKTCCNRSFRKQSVRVTIANRLRKWREQIPSASKDTKGESEGRKRPSLRHCFPEIRTLQMWSWSSCYIACISRDQTYGAKKPYTMLTNSYPPVELPPACVDAPSYVIWSVCRMLSRPKEDQSTVQLSADCEKPSTLADFPSKDAMKVPASWPTTDVT